MKGDNRFVVTMLVPTFFFLICFYFYPTLYNLNNSFTDLSLFGMKKGGDWIGLANSPAKRPTLRDALASSQVRRSSSIGRTACCAGSARRVPAATFAS